MTGARAGMAAALIWGLSDPVLRAVAGTEYSDVRLLGRAVTRSRAWPAVGLAMHVANGAVFGVVFSRAGLRGVKQGVVAAELENLVLWPGFAVVDRVHPDRRDGTWPRLLTNRRVAVYAVAGHALFGAVLGGLSD
jgi:hypothetical protein